LAGGEVIVPEDGVTLPEGTTVTVIADAEAGGAGRTRTPHRPMG
jgi:hypothetical protein